LSKKAPWCTIRLTSSTSERETIVTEQRLKKDEYQKGLAAFGQAMKEFHKGDLEKAVELLKSFIEKYPSEREVVDRASIYLAFAQKHPKKETVSPRTFEDYCRAGVARINQADYAGAGKFLEKALEFKQNEGLVHYLLADVHCLTGRQDDCLDELKKAIQKDKMYAVMAQNESDFQALWEDKKFKVLTRLA
jgi:tetratricopeptide (TPR) repeat protein